MKNPNATILGRTAKGQVSQFNHRSMNTEQNYVGGGDNATQPTQTAPNSGQTQRSVDNRLTLQASSFLQTPFQAALLFTAEKQRSKPSFAAFVCYLNGQQVIEVERLNALSGHNPQVNLMAVIGRIKREPSVTGVIIATWHHSTSEDPYAEEFEEEVYRQFDILSEAGIKLIDNLRLSETGAYSYYGYHEGPYSDSPSYHEQSICRLY